jgi:predicted ATPase
MMQQLAARKLLLILDSFERLRSGHEFVLELLQRAPEATVLVTSRRRLRIQAEYIVHIGGLPAPPEPPAGPGRANKQAAKADGCSSVRLFAERAERTGGRFKLTEAVRPHVLQICRLVDGLPLAIELAAGMTGRRSCAEIARGIAAGPDYLATTLLDVPERHRSLRAVFEHSWRTLTAAEQDALARCSVFKGSFGEAAALAVTGASSATLAALVNESLLQKCASGRYSLHTLARQLLSEKLAAMGAAMDALDRHSAFYLHWLAGQTERFGGDAGALPECQQDLADLRAAWAHAATVPQPALLAVAARGMSQLYVRLGWMTEGASAFAEATGRLRGRPGPATQRALAALLLEASRFQERPAWPAEAESPAADEGQAGGRSRLAAALPTPGVEQ